MQSPVKQVFHLDKEHSKSWYLWDEDVRRGMGDYLVLLIFSLKSNLPDY